MVSGCNCRPNYHGPGAAGHSDGDREAVAGFSKRNRCECGVNGERAEHDSHDGSDGDSG